MRQTVTDGATVLEIEETVVGEFEASKPSGPPAAALLAAGIGAAALGFLTTLAELSPGIKAALNLYNPVGPLSGKTIVAVAAYLLSWAILAIAWRGKEVRLGPVFLATFVLIGLGLLGTFPLFFELFTAA